MSSATLTDIRGDEKRREAGNSLIREQATLTDRPLFRGRKLSISVSRRYLFGGLSVRVACYEVRREAARGYFRLRPKSVRVHRLSGDVGKGGDRG